MTPVLLLSPGLGDSKMLSYDDPETVLVDCGACGLSVLHDLTKSLYSVIADHRHVVAQHEFYRALRGSTVPALPAPSA